MTRRFLLVCGLIFLALTMAGLLTLASSGLMRAERTMSLHMPDQLGTVPEAESALYQASPLTRPPFESPALGPLAGVLVAIFVAVAGTLIAGHGRAETDGIHPGARTALIWLGVLIGCMVMTTLGLALISFRPPPPQRSDAEMASMDATNQFMITAIHNTQTAVFDGQLQTETARPTLPPEPTWTPRPVTAGVPEPLTLRVEWPARINAGQEGWVEIYLFRPAFFDEPWDTPHPPYADPFGASYRGTIHATLTSGDFALIRDQFNADPQSLNTDAVAWRWSGFAPQSPGTRRLEVTIEALWEPASGQGQPIRWVVAKPVMITEVTRPPIPPDLLGWLTFAAGVIGAGLCVPWLYEIFRGSKWRN